MRCHPTTVEGTSLESATPHWSPPPHVPVNWSQSVFTVYRPAVHLCGSLEVVQKGGLPRPPPHSVWLPLDGHCCTWVCMNNDVLHYTPCDPMPEPHDLQTVLCIPPWARLPWVQHDGWIHYMRFSSPWVSPEGVTHTTSTPVCARISTHRPLHTVGASVCHLRLCAAQPPALRCPLPPPFLLDR